MAREKRGNKNGPEKADARPGPSNQQQPENGNRPTRKRAAPQQGPTKRPRRQDAPLAPVPACSDRRGLVLTCGQGDTGQLGLGQDIMETLRPRRVPLDFAVVDIVAGAMHTVCLSAAGEVYTFGCNDEGALGRDTTGDDDDEEALFQAGKVELPERVVMVCAGNSHTAALSEHGRVYIWGNFRDNKGQMGLLEGGQMERLPVRILGDVVVVKIASGEDHLVCLSNNGTLYTCGSGEQGQLGRIAKYFLDRGGRRGIGYSLNPAPVALPKIRGSSPIIFDQVWTGSWNTFARDRDTGRIYGCGINTSHQLGLDDGDLVLVPQQLHSFDEQAWVMMEGGQHHTLALNNNGQIFSLGMKQYGRLGLGPSCDNQSRPTLVSSKEKFSLVSCFDCGSFSISNSGMMFSWGMGTNGQLGHGSDTDIFVPTAVNACGRLQVLKVSGGAQHTVILARK